MEEKFLKHIKFQQPPLILGIAAGTALILSTVQITLTNGAHTFIPPARQAVYTPIKLPKTTPKIIKPKNNPFLPAAGPDIKQQKTLPQPLLKGIIQNGAAAMAIIEYDGQSSYYQNGDKINGFTLQNISTGGVLLHKNGQTLTLANGGQQP